MNKRQIRDRLLFGLLFTAFLCLTGFGTSLIRAKAAQVIPLYIYADYSGGPAIIGEKINTDALQVYAVFEDGSIVEVGDYYLSNDMILREGTNEIVVFYLGKRVSIYVQGRTVTQLYAYYTGNAVSVGNAVDKRDLIVQAFYSDGSISQVTDFNIGNAVITKTGENRIYLSYAGKGTTVTVQGKTSQRVSSILVTYTGDDVMLGSKINRDDIYVNAIYADGSVETIVNYELSSETTTMIGVNTIVVTYQYRTATFVVNGYEKGIKKLAARYTGGGVEVGKEVRKADIEVKATYTDGSVEQVWDFSLPTPVIYYVGAHEKTVHYMGLTADIYVIGIEAMKPNYNNASTFVISNGSCEATCMIAMPADLDQGSITGESLGKASVSRVIPRAIRRSNFIAFEITAEEDGEDELPLEMKIVVPTGYRAEDCALYFTPNRKTIIARMNTEISEEGYLLLKLYKTGTFILAYEPDENETESDD